MNLRAASGFAGALLLTAPAFAAEPTMVGAIKSFECGDNCYLTIKTAKGQEETGLCTATACDPWNNKTEIPRKLIGKHVRVTLGAGEQVDGSNTVQGHMIAFKRIEFLD